MGDRCYCEITVAAEHEEILRKHGYVEELERGERFLPTANGATLAVPTWVTLADCEANCAGAYAREELRAAGIPYVGQHEEGGAYGAYAFAFDGKREAELPKHKDVGLCWPIADGNLDTLLTWASVNARACDLIGYTPDADNAEPVASSAESYRAALRQCITEPDAHGLQHTETWGRRIDAINAIARAALAEPVAAKGSESDG